MHLHKYASENGNAVRLGGLSCLVETIAGLQGQTCTHSADAKGPP